jgi:hypothetical protein
VLRALRRTKLASLFALLVITGSVPLSLLALAHDADDAICQPPFVLHDEAAHRIGAASAPTSAPEHCATCHWLQSLQTVVAATVVAIPATDVEHHIASAVVAVARTLAGDVSPRAPPLA